MTVKELIKRLSKLEPNRIVVLSRDPEGNGFAPLADISQDAYREGAVGLEKLTPELRHEGFTEEDVLHNGQKAVILWPMH